MPRAVLAAVLLVSIPTKVAGCRAASVEHGRPAATAVAAPARAATGDAPAAAAGSPSRAAARAPQPPDRRIHAPSPGIDLRSGAAACALCPGPVPRIVVVGRPDDPAFVERARDADAVAAKYPGRLEARIVARNGTAGGATTAGTGGDGAGTSGAFAQPAWVARLRVDAPVIAAAGPVELPEAYAALADGQGPLVLLVLEDGDVAYAAAAPEDFAALHGAFLARRPAAKAPPAAAGPASDRG